ncbi:response regulator receiver domain [Rhizobium brockwellii]|uniref:response regulator receiver domain n=1 Tax=Rhizobium brockwellii TaxID=3019932 RepID=UPI003F97BEB2
MGREHSALLKEVFLNPIRSVLIVDDDYPTYEDILSGDGEDTKRADKPWRRNPGAVLNVIRSFRELEVPPLIDIHDGFNLTQGKESRLATHLHQSDLLVLDYQLDGIGGDGTKSIEIIKSLMRNNHFNLVVVHTSADLQNVFDDVLLSLLEPCRIKPSQKELEQIAEMLFDAEADAEGLTRQISDAFQLSQYLKTRANFGKARKAFFAGEEPFTQLKQACKRVADWKAPDLIKVFSWACCAFEDGIKHKLNEPDSESINWSASDPYWIRSGTAFIAFTNKSNDARIMDDLLEALLDWKPEPSRLFLAKFRAQIDELGVTAENTVMGDRFVLARWYEQLLSGSKETRKTLIGETVDRHTEQLVANVRRDVEVFADKVVEIDSARSAAGVDVINEYFGIDLTNPGKRRQAERDHNIFISSKPPAGWHLNTGHVFECEDHKWICLSPACDLVPRARAMQNEDLGKDVTSFLAVRLHDRGDGMVKLDDIQSNRYVYVKIDGSPKMFVFNESADANPFWAAMYALNQGKFREGFKFDISRLRRVGDELKATVTEARVVGQLRYEYALNLVQKLGVSFTRVGLDFSG